MHITGLTKTKAVRDGAVTYQISLEDEGTTEVLIFTSDHPHVSTLGEAVDAFLRGDLTGEDFGATVKRLYSLVALAEEKLVRVEDILEGRMTIQDNSVMVDGDPIDPSLEAHLLRLLQANGTPKDEANWTSFAKFVNKLYQNASESVRLQFFGWLNHVSHGRGFTLTSEGNVIGYKGCKLIDDVPHSIHSGPAMVDGVAVDGFVPNRVGSLVEMKRSQVTVDPTVGCSSGLHVGTYAYASSFQRGVLLTVEFDPRDIGSVPYECDAQKVRVWRYRVLEVTKTQYQEPTWPTAQENDWEEDSPSEEEASASPEEEQVLDALYDQGGRRVPERAYISFQYTKANQEPVAVEGTLLFMDKGGLVHLLKDGEEDRYRTYREERMSFLRVVTQDAQEEVAEPTVGSVVDLSYTHFDGSETTYTVELVKVTDTSYYGQLQASRFVKVFAKDRVVFLA